ncbi:MAG: cell division topological specificity factor MinE [Clostridia bacterium]
MFENIMKFFKKLNKKENNVVSNSKDAAKERLHLVLMQDRANVSADFLELMKQEIIEVIKKYIDVDESAIDVRLTNKENSDGTNGAPALYANIPILNIKNEARKVDVKQENDKSKEVKNETDKKTIEPKEDSKKEPKKEVEKNQVEKAQEVESNVTAKTNKEVKNNKKSKDENKKENSTKEEIKSEN